MIKKDSSAGNGKFRFDFYSIATFYLGTVRFFLLSVQYMRHLQIETTNGINLPAVRRCLNWPGNRICSRDKDGAVVDEKRVNLNKFILREIKNNKQAGSDK